MTTSSKRATGTDVLAGLATPFGLTGLFILLSYLLPALGSPVFLTIERREGFAIAFFGAFAFWMYFEILRGNPGLRKLPERRGWRRIVLTGLLGVGHLLILFVLGFCLFWFVVFPGTLLFGVLAVLAQEATPRPPYGHRIACDFLLFGALGLTVPGLLPLARRLGFAAGGPEGASKRWIVYAAIIAAGVGVIAIVALIGRLDPMLFRRLFLPPVEQ